MYYIKKKIDMQPYAVSVVPSEDLAIFYRVREIIQRLPEIDLGLKDGRKVLVSCHMLARALADIFHIECKDGYFGDICEHSWLATNNGLIIDVYPVGVVGGPLLVDTRFMLPWSSFYREAVLPKLHGADFSEHIDLVTAVVRQAAADLGFL